MQMDVINPLNDYTPLTDKEFAKLSPQSQLVELKKLQWAITDRVRRRKEKVQAICQKHETLRTALMAKEKTQAAAHATAVNKQRKNRWLNRSLALVAIISAFLMMALDRAFQHGIGL